MTDIKKLEVQWNKISWEVSARIGADMSDIVKWGELTFLSGNNHPKVLVEFDAKLCKIQINDTKVYTGTSFPTDNMKKCIASSLVRAHEKYGDSFKFILLDKNYQLFGGRGDYKDPWTYLGIETDEWKPLNFSTYCDWFDTNGIELGGPDLFWKIGDQLFRTPTMYSERVLGTIVLADYCDKFVPKQNGEVKPVSFWGFATLVMFLRKIIGDTRSITTSQLRTLYNDFDRAKCIPVIPTRWKTTDIELMNTRRLDLILKELEDKKIRKEEKEAEELVVKNLEENWEKDPETNLEKNSTETSSISEMLKNAKNLVQKQITLAKEEPSNDNTLNEHKPIKLSKILSGQAMLTSEIWGAEYMVNIDTNITEGGISIAESEMLIAIISYGFLEILVEDDVQRKLCKELAEIVEEKYGIAVQFLGLDEDGAKDILKRGEEISAKS